MKSHKIQNGKICNGCFTFEWFFSWSSVEKCVINDFGSGKSFQSQKCHYINLCCTFNLINVRWLCKTDSIMTCCRTCLGVNQAIGLKKRLLLAVWIGLMTLYSHTQLCCFVVACPDLFSALIWKLPWNTKKSAVFMLK